MNDAVIEFVCGFIVIMSAAIFYVLWDNSVKKNNEINKQLLEYLESQDSWMNEIENLVSNCSNTNIYYIKQKREIYEKCKNRLESCIKKN